MMIKRIVFMLAFCSMAVAYFAGSAQAAMDTAYIVVSDKNVEAASSVLQYLKASGTNYVQVAPEDLTTLEGKPYFIVIGSPKDKDAVSAFAKNVLSAKQWDNAMEMGKSGPVTVASGSSNVLFFFSDYSLKSLMDGSKDRWTEIFYDWYDIPLSITQIIGY